MLSYVSGDLLKSEAECLVNTVNCEGYMGKGIAYQFKLAFPNNNEDYIRACKTSELRIGKLHYIKEKGKIIINFPTKDTWRANSKMEYIEKGLDELVMLIKHLNIKSIAIPPLGSGNGGLIWADVKILIEKKLTDIAENVQIFIYEPSQNYVAKATAEPHLSLSALVLMQIKLNLVKFNSKRLQKTAFLVDIFGAQPYFKFIKHKYGPYDHAIDVISKSIKEFQQFHNVKTTDEAYEIAYKKLTSESIDSKLCQLKPRIERATCYVNSISDDNDLECLATILFLIKQNGTLEEDSIVAGFKMWSEDKANRFPENKILEGLQYLYNTGIIEMSLLGYCIPEVKKGG